MNRLRLSLCIAVAAGFSSFALSPATASAIGYFNVPGNCCQWWGCGCGAGYHAPLVLGPICWHGCCTREVERWPCAPSPPCCYAGYGYGCAAGCEVGEPSMLEPTVAPGPLPAPAPDPAPGPAAYRTPFRY